MHKKITIFSISSLLIFTALTPIANAGTASGKLTIKATIGIGCKVTSGDNSVLDFGNLEELTKGTAKAQTTDSSGINVQCTKDVAYKIGLDGGQNYTESGAYGGRRMKSGNNAFFYYLYSDSATSKLWGDDTNMLNLGPSVSGVGTGDVVKYTVYGKVTSQATPPAGQYSDQVTITVSY